MMVVVVVVVPEFPRAGRRSSRLLQRGRFPQRQTLQTTALLQAQGLVAVKSGNG